VAVPPEPNDPAVKIGLSASMTSKELDVNRCVSPALTNVTRVPPFKVTTVFAS